MPCTQQIGLLTGPGIKVLIITMRAHINYLWLKL